MKKNKTLINDLRKELRYWQMQARIDARNLKGSRNKCKEIGAKMRALQAPPLAPPQIARSMQFGEGNQTLDNREARF